MTALDDIRFRSNPGIELRRLGDLAAGQREVLRDLESDADFYGLLVPRPPLSMNLKAVERQTAELFQQLTTPSRLDRALLGTAGYAEDVVDLVLDGILEIEKGDGFVSGADALPIVCEDAAPPEPRDAVARLSREALLHAQDLETGDAQAMTTALYLYNRIPASPFWKRRFATREDVLGQLGANRGSLAVVLARHWAPVRHAGAWWSWSPKHPLPRTGSDVTYKLYISPRPERIRDAFEVVVRVFATLPNTQFKIGDSAAGLLRPDKFVSYFETKEQLLEAADALQRELAGCDAQGVPFTAGIDAGGLLSWGVDPPDNDRALRWLGRESWRMWVAERLGAALAIAKRSRGADAVEPWRFAIERARRHGVDVETWTPSETLWSGP